MFIIHLEMSVVVVAALKIISMTFLDGSPVSSTVMPVSTLLEFRHHHLIELLINFLTKSRAQ